MFALRPVLFMIAMIMVPLRSFRKGLRRFLANHMRHPIAVAITAALVWSTLTAIILSTLGRTTGWLTGIVLFVALSLLEFFVAE